MNLQTLINNLQCIAENGMNKCIIEKNTNHLTNCKGKTEKIVKETLNVIQKTFADAENSPNLKVPVHLNGEVAFLTALEILKICQNGSTVKKKNLKKHHEKYLIITYKFEDQDIFVDENADLIRKCNLFSQTKKKSFSKFHRKQKNNSYTFEDETQFESDDYRMFIQSMISEKAPDFTQFEGDLAEKVVKFTELLNYFRTDSELRDNLLRQLGKSISQMVDVDNLKKQLGALSVFDPIIAGEIFKENSITIGNIVEQYNASENELKIFITKHKLNILTTNFIIKNHTPVYEFPGEALDKKLIGLTMNSQIQKIEYLNFTGISSELVDDAILFISKFMPNLHTLDLGASDEITDEGLGYLAELQNLHTLNLTGCNQITDEGRNILKKALPELIIK